MSRSRGETEGYWPATEGVLPDEGAVLAEPDEAAAPP
jgi:hypothetical protein